MVMTGTGVKARLCGRRQLSLRSIRALLAPTQSASDAGPLAATPGMLIHPICSHTRCSTTFPPAPDGCPLRRVMLHMNLNFYDLILRQVRSSSPLWPVPVKYGLFIHLPSIRLPLCLPIRLCSLRATPRHHRVSPPRLFRLAFDLFPLTNDASSYFSPSTIPSPLPWASYPSSQDHEYDAISTSASELAQLHRRQRRLRFRARNSKFTPSPTIKHAHTEGDDQDSTPWRCTA
ncbi:hypothetical protein EDB89DRAFT_316009 [Lactarius sanguifluus]|nr:hypothetical protein EDB89DRAFT_316009 [Lactarius sanguifluus]